MSKQQCMQNVVIAGGLASNLTFCNYIAESINNYVFRHDSPMTATLDGMRVVQAIADPKQYHTYKEYQEQGEQRFFSVLTQ